MPTLRVLVLAAVAILVVAGGCRDRADQAHGKKVVIIGADGMDPKLVESLMTEGRLPNFARLRDEGGFRRLTTSIPPQSPVAWSNFITGAGPGVHGIFDFLHRDPKNHAMPYWSGNMAVPVSAEDYCKIGQYRIPYPWVKAENKLLRRGTPFWEHLDANGIPVFLYRMPANYPPTPSKYGQVKTLDDMGVPDAMGEQGTYQHYSSNRRRESKEYKGYKLRLRQDYNAGAYVGRLYGPSNDFRASTPQLYVDLSIYPDPEKDVAKIVFTNTGVMSDETVETVLDAGEWSEWTEVHFLETPAGPSFKTMVRFLLQEVRPELRLYASPLNFIPTAPEIVFSDPAKFVTEIGKQIGPFYTKGFAEDYNALKYGDFTDEEYRTQSSYVLEERFRILDYALDHFKDGLLFVYFSTTDLQAHMFWWNTDDKHPVRNPQDAKRYNAVVADTYVKIDEALGRCRARLGDDVTYLVVSDHGFANFRRGVAVNTFLRNEGYLTARTGLLIDTDWTRTRAYSLGVGGSIYLNLRGREDTGIVDSSERDALLREISGKLMTIVDPETGRPVIHRVYRADECYSGPEARNAPDLILGYEEGYRASWNTCLGDFDKAVVVDNDNAWSADHCEAPDLVPGILLSNRKIVMDEPALIDAAPTVLAEFGLARPDYMTGRSFFEKTVTQAAPVAAAKR